MGVEPYNFVSALNCILAHRLVRLICDSWRTAVHYQRCARSQWTRSSAVGQVPLYEGQGCIEVRGYPGLRGGLPSMNFWI